MPGKIPPIKLPQVKVPVYAGRATPARFESWLVQVVNLNTKDRSLLTEGNIKCAWIETLRKLDLHNRVEEMNSKAAKSAILDSVSKSQAKEQERMNAVQNGRGRWRAPSVLTGLDNSDYKVPSIGSKHLEAVKYAHYAKQVQQANKDKPFTQEVVEACFWTMVNDLLKKVGTNHRATPLLNQAKSVMTQADTYWMSLEVSEL